MDYLTKITVVHREGARTQAAPFDRISIKTPGGLLAEIEYLEGKTSAYEVHYTLTRKLNALEFVLVQEDGKEQSVHLIPGTRSYEFVLPPPPPNDKEVGHRSGKDRVDGDGPGKRVGELSPWQVLDVARKAVPAVNYALGVAGIAAAASFVVLFIGQTQASVVMISLVFFGMVMLFVFSRVAISTGRSVQLVGAVMLWSILVFFIIFLGFTVTAFSALWPPAWADFLGIMYTKTEVPHGQSPKAESPPPPDQSSVRPMAQITPPAITWPITQDRAIDQTHAALNTLDKNPNPTEGQLVAALRNIFYKPIFRHVLEEKPEGALFAYCRAQLLLEAYVSKFGSPDVRRKLQEATQNLISLQDQFGALYGPSFRRDIQCAQHGNTLQDYTSTLPPLMQNMPPAGPQFDKAMRTLGVLRSNLSFVNLMD